MTATVTGFRPAPQRTFRDEAVRELRAKSRRFPQRPRVKKIVNTRAFVGNNPIANAIMPERCHSNHRGGKRYVGLGGEEVPKTRSDERRSLYLVSRFYELLST
ncbi:MAG: hypothetical protein AB7G75_15395 [Candidatus Binatia bacterium]